MLDVFLSKLLLENIFSPHLLPKKENLFITFST